MLALRAREREVVVSTAHALGAATTKLLLHGQTEAAHMVAEDVGLAELPNRVRLLGIRLSPGDDPGLARFRRHRREHPFQTFYQIYIHLREIHARIIAGQHVFTHFGQRTGHFHARWASPGDHER